MRLQAFLVTAPLAFAALLTQHPTGGGDFYSEVADNLTPWMTVHYGAAILFPTMALVVWLLLRGLPGRAAAVARVALPVFAVLFGVYEANVGIAGGLAADAGSRATFDAIVSSPVVGESGIFLSVGSIAWWTAISGAILALRQAGASAASLVLLGIGGLMVFHALAGPFALVALAAAAYLIERRRPSTRPTHSFSNRPSGSSSARAAWKASHSG
jgi:hypothetical protein